MKQVVSVFLLLALVGSVWGQEDEHRAFLVVHKVCCSLVLKAPANHPDKLTWLVFTVVISRACTQTKTTLLLDANSRSLTQRTTWEPCMCLFFTYSFKFLFVAVSGTLKTST